MNFEEQLHSTGLLSTPYMSSPANDIFIFQFLVTYLNVVKGLSLEAIRAFTTYDFINLEGVIKYKGVFSAFETKLMDIYLRFIRVNWIKNKDESTLPTALVKSPCGQFVALTGIFFVDTVGSEDWTIDQDMASDLENQNDLSLPRAEDKTRRPRRATICSVSSIRNCQAKKQAVYEKCLLQQWIGVDVMESCPGGRGRGLIAANNFAANEIIVDYHARRITKNEAQQIEDDPEDYRYNYMFCGPNGLFWDGSPESCICHPQSRILGRLANFAAKNTDECNAKPQFVEFKHTKNQIYTTIILVATRDIKCLEEIRFDYGDKHCLELFK